MDFCREKCGFRKVDAWVSVRAFCLQSIANNSLLTEKERRNFQKAMGVVYRTKREAGVSCLREMAARRPSGFLPLLKTLAGESALTILSLCHVAMRHSLVLCLYIGWQSAGPADGQSHQTVSHGEGKAPPNGTPFPNGE